MNGISRVPNLETDSKSRFSTERMPSITSHKHISPQSLPQLDEMTYRRAAFRKVSVDPQLNFVNPVNRRGSNYRNNLQSEQAVKIEDLSNTYQSSVKIGQVQDPKQQLQHVAQSPRLLETQQKCTQSSQISYTQFLQMHNTSSFKPGSIQHNPSTTSVSIVNQITPAKVIKELKILNDFLDTQEIYYNENLPTSVAERDFHTQLVFSIEKSYRKVIAKVLKQLQKNQVLDEIVVLFKRAIKGLDSVQAQERDFTKNVFEKLQDDTKKAWQAKEQIDLEFEHFKQTETLEAYFAKFKINPTREFRLEMIANVNMWLSGSNADAVDPMMHRDQNINTGTSGVEKVLEMLSDITPFENPKVSDQLSFEELEKDQENFIIYQREKIRRDALSVARVAEQNTKKILQISGGKMPTMDHGTGTDTWMKVTRDFMDRIQQLESQINKHKIVQQNQGVEAQRTIESLRKDLKVSQEFQSMIRQQVIDCEKQLAYMKQLMESKLGQDAVQMMDKDLEVFNEKKKEIAAKINVLQSQKNSSQQIKKLPSNTDLQDPVSLTSSVELKKGIIVNQDLEVVENVFSMTKDEIQNFVPEVQKMALVYQVFQANANALKYKGFYENLDKIIQVFMNVPFLLDQLFVLSQTKDQALLKILNFGCIGESQALKKVVERIFTKSKTNQIEGTNVLCENVMQLRQITYDAAAFISFFNKEKNNKKADIKKKVQQKLQQAKKLCERSEELFEKLPSEIGLENSRLMYIEAQDCVKSLSIFFKENLANKEIAKEMTALQNLVQELKNAIQQITETTRDIIKECGDCDAITKQFKRLIPCIVEERERQRRAPIEIVSIMDTPPGSSKKAIQKSLASQLSLESFTPQKIEDEARTIFILDEAQSKSDSIIEKKKEGPEKKVQPVRQKSEEQPEQERKNESLLSKPDLDGLISQGVIQKLTEQFAELDYKMVGPVIQESVNQTIESLRNELNLSFEWTGPPKQAKIAAMATLQKAVKKVEVKKEIPSKVKEHKELIIKEPGKVKDKPKIEGEDPFVVLARQEARIADAVSKAVAEVNGIHKAEMARLKGYDEKDNCKSCGKPKIGPGKEPDRQQSEVKQPKDVKVKPAAIAVPARKVDKQSKQDDSKFQAKETQINVGNQESKLLELVVKSPRLLNNADQEIEHDNISFSTQHIILQTEKEQKEFDVMHREVHRANFGQELDHPFGIGIKSPQREDQMLHKMAKPVPQKSELKNLKSVFQKDKLSALSFTSSLDKDELSPQKSQTNLATPFVHVKDENEGYELQTPSKINTFYDNLQGKYSTRPSVPKGHTLFLDQSTQTENKKLLREILVMINEAFFDNLQKFESVPQHELQMTIDSFNKTMPQVYEQISSEANTFLVTNSVKYLNPSASCQKLGKQEQEQASKQRAPLALQDFSRYGYHTLELNQEIKERITVKTIGHIGGGFMGHQKR